MFKLIYMLVGKRVDEFIGTYDEIQKVISGIEFGTVLSVRKI